MASLAQGPFARSWDSSTLGFYRYSLGQVIASSMSFGGGVGFFSFSLIF